jgi:5-methyltetrahydropteroyltriglutamate--homocysteine methyltransferase
MKTTICGNYPKIDSKKSKVNLRQAINRYDKRQIKPEELEQVIGETVSRSLDDQLECGIDYPTDGQIRWSDLCSPFCEAVDGVESGGLRRFFDNNVYYRKPQIRSELKRSRKIIADDLQFLKSISSAPVKATLCGPISFADLSDDNYYKDFEKLATEIAKIIHEELIDLDKLGVEYIQLDEPSLPLRPHDFEFFTQLLKMIFEDVRAKRGVAFYFNRMHDVVERLGELPVDFVAIDFISHPDIIYKLPPLDKIELHAGLIDARNLMLEEADVIEAKIELINARANPKEIVLTTSCGLEFLPRNYAKAKMRRLCEIAESL